MHCWSCCRQAFPRGACAPYARPANRIRRARYPRTAERFLCLQRNTYIFFRQLDALRLQPWLARPALARIHSTAPKCSVDTAAVRRREKSSTWCAKMAEAVSVELHSAKVGKPGRYPHFYPPPCPALLAAATRAVGDERSRNRQAIQAPLAKGRNRGTLRSKSLAHRRLRQFPRRCF